VHREDQFEPAIRSLVRADGQQPTGDVELVPEPFGPQGEWSISIRHTGRTIGYVDGADAPAWAGVVRRVIASGCVPTTGANIVANDYGSYVYIALSEPAQALPFNDPPAAHYTLLPRSSPVQVTKEEEYYGALLKFVPPGGRAAMFVTLHEREPLSPKSKPLVEVRIDDECIGQLTPQTSLRYLPMIQRLASRGLLTAARGDIVGSAVAAEVRVHAMKANEVDNDFLSIGIAMLPTLVPVQSDPRAYDISKMSAIMQPPPPVRPPPPPPEPPDGSVVRFDSGRYNYVAVRRGDHWETSATQNWGIVNESMRWDQLATPGRRFEIADGWSPIDLRTDPRVRQHLAVVRFIIDDQYLAAINIDPYGNDEGDWYTTVTGQAESVLPIGDRPSWSQISSFGKSIQMPTQWVPVM